MQGNQFPSSNENINIQLRLSPLILLSEGLEKEANELRGRSDAAFFFSFFFGIEYRRTVFFPSSRPTKEVENNNSSSSQGKIQGLSLRLCSSPVPTRGHGTGSIPGRAGRCRPEPRGKGRTALSAKCLPRPAPRRAAGRSIPRIPPGCWQPEPLAASPEPRGVLEPDAASSPHWELPVTAGSARWPSHGECGARFALPSRARMLAERPPALLLRRPRLAPRLLDFKLLYML